MTLTDLLAAVYEDCNYSPSPAAAVTTRLTRYLNEGLQAVVAEPGLSRLLDSNAPATFTSVANQARYGLHESVSEILSMRDLDNDRSLDWMDLQQYRRMDPDPASRTGVPVYYVPLGVSSVAAQPSAAAEVFIISTSASDTHDAHLECVLSDGTRRLLDVTMTGTTGVSFSAAVNTIVSVEDVYLDANAVGTVTVREGSGTGPVLATIPPGQPRARYQSFYLYPTPSGAWAYAVDYRRTLVTLSEGTDEPPLPLEFHPMLVKYAAFREWEHKDDTRATLAYQQYEKWLSRLKYRQHSTGDSVPASGRYRRPEYSRLGGWFPADRW